VFMRIRAATRVLPFALIILLAVASPSIGQDEGATESESYLLRWSPTEGERYTYMLSTSGIRGEAIAVRSEDFTIEVVEASEGVFSLVARGEPVPDGARLGLRFQRSLFPQFAYTVDSLGSTTSSPGQPFPPFLNIPILPEREVAVGATWSGGAVAILPDANVGSIPFEFESTLSSTADFMGEECAVIETAYTVALEEKARSLMPFLGLVEGDEPEQPGTGAPIGGVVEGSRAHEAGIEPGDLIVAAEGQRIRGWGGLEEILPLLVPDMPVDFTVERGEEEFSVEVAPEGLPLAWISGAGGLRSTCYFSIARGIPMRVDLASEDLVFTLTNAEGETEERPADIHIVLEYKWGGR